MTVGRFAGLGARLRAADQSAVTDLFEALGGRVLAHCFRRTLDARAAAGLAELTFLDAWRLRDRAPFADRTLEAWLFGLALSRCHPVPLPDRSAIAGEPEADERALLEWWDWLRNLPEPERDAVMLTEWEQLSRRQVAVATGGHPRRVPHLLASAAASRPPGLGPVPPARPVAPGLGDRLMERLMELPEVEEPVRPRPRPALALTGLLLVALVFGGYLLSRAPSPEPPPSSVPSAGTDRTLLQRCRLQQGFDPSLLGLQETDDPVRGEGTADPVRGLVFFNPAGQVQLCGSLGDRIQLSEVAQPDSSGGSLARLLMRSGDTLTVLMAGALPSGTLRATVLDTTSGVTRWSGRVWWMVRTLPASTVVDQPPTVFVLFDGADATRTWLVPWVGSRVQPPRPRWEQAAGMCGAALHSDQPVPGLRLLLPGPGGSSGNGFLVVSQDDRLWTCSVGDAGWIGPPVTAGASGASGVAVSTPQIMDAAQTLVVGGRVPPGVSSVSVEVSGASHPAIIDHGYWVWSRTIDNRLLPLQPNRITVRMRGSQPRSVVVDWLRDYAGISPHTWAPLFGTPLGSRCGAGTGPRVESLGGHVQTYGPTTRGGTGMLCFGTDDEMHRIPLGRFSDSLSLHVLTEPGPDGSRLFAAGGALPTGVEDIVVHTPVGAVPATVARGYWALEWVWPGHPPAPLPPRVSLTWTQDGRSMSRMVAVPGS